MYRVLFLPNSTYLFYATALGETLFGFTLISQLPHDYPGASHMLANCLKL